MARIRTVKPEFFTSEDVVCLSPVARLLYIGLWCEADREGRFAWRPGSFRLRYLPTDECDIQAVCDELVSRGLVVLYGDGLACVPSFSKHQNINPRESASTLPEPEHGSDPPARARVSDASPRVSNAQGGRKEGRKEVGREGNTPRAREASPSCVVPFDAEYGAMPTRQRSRHCAWESTLGVDVPQQLHAEVVQKFANAGHPDPEAFALAWYRRTEEAWRGRPFGDDTWAFWRGRQREELGTSVTRAAAPKVAGLTGGGVAVSPYASEPWTCRHEPRCHHRTACALATTREVRAGIVALEDVQPALRRDVEGFVEPEAVEA